MKLDSRVVAEKNAIPGPCGACMSGTSKSKTQPVIAWAWMLENGELCFWSAPSRKQLLDDARRNGGKPSTNARAVRVRMTLIGHLERK